MNAITAVGSIGGVEPETMGSGASPMPAMVPETL
jgi:hypothetical protein